MYTFRDCPEAYQELMSVSGIGIRKVNAVTNKRCRKLHKQKLICNPKECNLVKTLLDQQFLNKKYSHVGINSRLPKSD